MLKIKGYLTSLHEYHPNEVFSSIDNESIINAPIIYKDTPIGFISSVDLLEGTYTGYIHELNSNLMYNKKTNRYDISSVNLNL